MHIPLAEAETRLPDLVRRAAAGEEVVLTTDHGTDVRFVPVASRAAPGRRWALLEALYGSAKDDLGPSAARSADFLYDDHGLPA